MPHLPELPIREFIVYDPIDPAVLDAIQTHLTYVQEDGQHPSTAAAFDASQVLLGANDGAPVDALRAVSERIQTAQRSRTSLVGKTTIRAVLLPFRGGRMYPWHSDAISNAYVAATLASTEGLSGTIPAESPKMVEAAVREAAKNDEDLKHLATVKVTTPVTGSLIQLPEGVVHRSPAPAEGQDDIRLLINGVVMPNFIMTMFG